MNDPEIQAAQGGAVEVIRKQVGDLGAALATWHARDDAGPCPEARVEETLARDSVAIATAWPLPRPGLSRDGTVAGALAPPAGVVAHARGCPWPPSQKAHDRLACRADLGVRMMLISVNLRKSKRDERPDPGQTGALAAD